MAYKARRASAKSKMDYGKSKPKPNVKVTKRKTVVRKKKQQ